MYKKMPVITSMHWFGIILCEATSSILRLLDTFGSQWNIQIFLCLFLDIIIWNFAISTYLYFYSKKPKIHRQETNFTGQTQCIFCLRISINLVTLCSHVWTYQAQMYWPPRSISRIEDSMGCWMFFPKSNIRNARNSQNFLKPEFCFPPHCLPLKSFWIPPLNPTIT